MPPKSLPIAAIRIDGDTQARVKLDSDYVRELIEAMNAGKTMPPLVVFFDGEDHWLADGLHRWHAYKSVDDYGDPVCDIRPGTVEDAQWYALTCNQDHGLRRTNEDKRYIVEEALSHKQANGLSNAVIAKHCGVNEITVRRHRKKQSNSDKVGVVKRKGLDGKVRSRKRVPPKTMPDFDPDAENPRDALGQEITDQKIMIPFMDGRLAEFAKKIAALRREWKLLRAEPVAHWANKDGIEVDLKNGQRAVESALPYALAPPAIAKQKRFKIGWMTKGDYERIPK